MKFIRIIPKLDIKNGQLIKGINLEGLRVLGDPMMFAKEYYDSGADEIFYQDNVATLYGTNNLSKFVSKTVKNIFIPITVGGGIRNIEDVDMMLKAGADRICINSSAIDNIEIIKKASRIYGSSTICSLIEVIKIDRDYYITKSNGRDIVKIHPLDWAKKLEQNGTGEIILTIVNHEGLQKGFDISLINNISKKITVPVIAHGGAGNFNHVLDVINKTSISGVAIASFFHYALASRFKYKKTKIGNFNYLENLSKYQNKNKNNLKNLKKFLKKNNINVR